VVKVNCHLLHTAIYSHHFSLFNSDLKTYHTSSEKLILHLSLLLSVCLISWLYAVFWINVLIGFYVLGLFISVLVIPTCSRLC